MERKADVQSVIVAFACGVAFGGVLSAVRRMNRWLDLDVDRRDEGRDALTNYMDDRFEGLVNTLKVVKSSVDELRGAVGDRRRGGVTPLAPKDGGHT